jgi:hypothetical protein
MLDEPEWRHSDTEALAGLTLQPPSDSRRAINVPLVMALTVAVNCGALRSRTPAGQALQPLLNRLLTSWCSTGPCDTGLVACRHPQSAEVVISGGRMTSGMVRRGDRLLRPMGPWSPAVHEYLRYLEAAGFDGAPRVLGIEGGREVLTFIGGDVANDPSWEQGHGHRLPPYAQTEMALRGAAELIRRLHRASAGFGQRSPAIASALIRRNLERSSRTVTSARGTPSTGTGCRWRSSTGTPPSPSSH